ncbi:hypothetical protein PIB30_015176 [Stylosanthes scabra]|uniref:Uncharacterized protein n=1 Tax=Stylosanthes scabra TaxID=79078 RepID=A0ABU6U9L4_9FABA|nr:hypothetical protein [Stylosanthes scabra]
MMLVVFMDKTHSRLKNQIWGMSNAFKYSKIVMVPELPENRSNQTSSSFDLRCIQIYESFFLPTLGLVFFTVIADKSAMVVELYCMAHEKDKKIRIVSQNLIKAHQNSN